MLLLPQTRQKKKKKPQDLRNTGSIHYQTKLAVQN